MFVGIILPRNISSQLEKEFVFALNQFSTIKESQVISNMSQEQKQRTSERIAKFLIDVGDKLAVGATSAATKTGKYMADKGEEYRANLVCFLIFCGSIRDRDGLPDTLSLIFFLDEIRSPTRNTKRDSKCET